MILMVLPVLELDMVDKSSMSVMYPSHLLVA